MDEEPPSGHEGLNVPTVESNPNPEYLLFVGCAGAFDDRIKKTMRALVEVLHAAKVNFAVLGEFVTGLADADMVSVAGPEWQLRPDSPVYRAARLAAAKDATQRAGEYAEAFGGRVTGLVEAADTGMLTPQPRHMAFAAKAAAAAGGDQGPAFDFEPAKQTVTAQVEARYTMTAPKFGT